MLGYICKGKITPRYTLLSFLFPGTLPRANQQSTGLILPARLCRAIVPRHDAKTNAARWFQNTRPRTAATIGATSSERATKIKAPTAGHANLYPRHALLSFTFPEDSPALFPTVHWTVGTGRDTDRPDELFSSSDGAQTVATSRIIAIKKQPYTLCKTVSGAPSGTRTQDPLIKSQYL